MADITKKATLSKCRTDGKKATPTACRDCWASEFNRLGVGV